MTDDASVAERGRWHLEVNNEYDILQNSSYPNLRQNDANFKASYGIYKDVELGFDNQLLAIFNDRNPAVARTAFGYGDIDLSVKWLLHKERPGSSSPSLAASFNLELPTGDSKRQLGSGIVDYYLNGIGQKAITKHNAVRGNVGIYFAGNTVTGAVGVRTTSGSVFTSGGSFVHAFTEKLEVGMELIGAVTQKFNLRKGQLQTEVGGNYKIKPKLSIDFGLVSGYYQASPRIAPIIGFSKDF